MTNEKKKFKPGDTVIACSPMIMALRVAALRDDGYEMTSLSGKNMVIPYETENEWMLYDQKEWSRLMDAKFSDGSMPAEAVRQFVGKLIVLNYDRESRLAFVEGIEKSSSDKEYADFCSIGGSSWGLRMDSGFTFRPATDLDINRAVIARCKDVAESNGYKF